MTPKVKTGQRREKPKHAEQGPQYRVEIMTASPEGLQAFMNKLKAIRAAHPVTMRLGRNGDGGPVGATIAVKGLPFKEAPLGPMTSDSEIGKYLGHLNRTVIPSRVDEYRWAMSAGNWWFTPDPIVVTDEGHIINGQHRLLAVEELVEVDVRALKNAKAVLARPVKQKPAPKPSESGRKTFDVEPFKDVLARNERAEAEATLVEMEARQHPQFVVVWGVDKRAAILMDESRRSATDRRDIAMRYARHV